MKPRSNNQPQSSSEMRGVIKKMAGRLTNDPKLEQEGESEMASDQASKGSRSPRTEDPDPHRRG